MSNSLDLFKKGLEENNDSSGGKQPKAGNPELNLTTVSDKTQPAKKPETQASTTPHTGSGETPVKFQSPTVQSGFTIKEDSKPSGDGKKDDDSSWVARFAGGAWNEGVSTVKAVAEIVGGKQSDIDERLRTTQIGPAGKANVIGNVAHSGTEMASSLKLMGGATAAKIGWAEDKQEYQTFRQAAGEFKDRLLSGDADAMGHATTFVGSLFVGGGLVGKGSKAGSSMRELQVAAKGWQEIGAADAALGSARALRTATTKIGSRVGDDIVNVARATELKGGTTIADLSLAGRNTAQVVSKESGVIGLAGEGTTSKLTATTLKLNGETGVGLAARMDGMPLITGAGSIEQAGVKVVGVDTKVGGSLAHKVDGLVVGTTERVVPTIEGKGATVTGLTDDVATKVPALHLKPTVPTDLVVPTTKVGEHVVTPRLNAGEHVVTPGLNAGEHATPIVKAGEHAPGTIKPFGAVGEQPLGQLKLTATTPEVTAVGTARTPLVHLETTAQEVGGKAAKLAETVTGPNAQVIRDDLAKFVEASKVAAKGGEEAVAATRTMSETLSKIKALGGETIVRELQEPVTRLQSVLADTRTVVNVVDHAAVQQTLVTQVGQQARQISTNVESAMAKVTGPNAATIKEDLSVVSRTLSEMTTAGGNDAQRMATINERLAAIEKSGAAGKTLVEELRPQIAKLEGTVADVQPLKTVQTATAHLETATQEVGQKAARLIDNVTGPNANAIKEELTKVIESGKVAGKGTEEALQASRQTTESINKIKSLGGDAPRIWSELQEPAVRLEQAVSETRAAVKAADQVAVRQTVFTNVQRQAGEIAAQIESKAATVTGQNAAQIKQDLSVVSKALSEMGTVGDDAQRMATVQERLTAIERAGGKSIVEELRPAISKFDETVSHAQPFKNLQTATSRVEATAQEVSANASKIAQTFEGPQAQLVRTETANIIEKSKVAATKSGEESSAAAESVRQSLARIEGAGGADLVRELKQSVAKFNQSMSEVQTAQTKVNEVVARVAQPLADDAARFVQPVAKADAVATTVAADAVKADVLKAGTQQAVARLEEHSTQISTKAEALAKTVTGPQAAQIQEDLQVIARTARELGTPGSDAARLATIEQKAAAIQKAEGGAQIINELRPVIGKIDDTVAHVEQLRKVENVVVRSETAAGDISRQAVQLAEKVEGPNAQAIRSELDKITQASKNVSGNVTEAQAATKTIRESADAIRAKGGTAIADALEQNVLKLEQTVKEGSTLRAGLNVTAPVETAATATVKPIVGLSDDMVRAQRQAFTRVEQGAQTLDQKAATLSENVTGRNAAKLQDELTNLSQTAKNVGKVGDDVERMSFIKERLAEIERTPGGAQLARELRPMVGQLDEAVAKAQPFRALEGSAARVEVASNEVGNSALRIAEKVEGTNAQLIKNELQNINTVARTETGQAAVSKIQESMAKIEGHGGGALLEDLRGPVAKFDTAVADAERMKSLTSATMKVESQSAEIAQKSSQLALKLDGPNAKVIEDHLTQINKTATKIADGTMDEAQGLNRIQQHMAVIESKGGTALVSDLKPMVSNLDRSVVEAQGLRNTVSQASRVETVSSNIVGETRRIAATLGDDAKSVAVKEKLAQIEESGIKAVQAGESPQYHIANINKNIAQIEAQGVKDAAAVRELRVMANQLETAQTYRTLEQSIAKVDAQAGNISRETKDLALKVDVSTQAGQVVKDQLQIMSRTADDIIANGDKSGALVKSMNQSLAVIEANGGAEIASGIRRSLTDLNEAVGTSKQAATNLFNHYSANVDAGFNVLRSQGHIAAQTELVAEMRNSIQMMRYLAPADASLLADLSKAEYHLSRAQSAATILSVSPEVAGATSKQLARMSLTADQTDLAVQKLLMGSLSSDSWLLRTMARPYQFVQTMVIGLTREPGLLRQTGLGLLTPDAGVAAKVMYGSGVGVLGADAARAYTLYRSYQQRDAELSAQHIKEYQENQAKNAQAKASDEVRSDDPRFQAVPKNRQDELRLSPNTEALLRPNGVIPTTHATNTAAEVNGVAANNPDARMFNDNLITKGRIWGTWGLSAAAPAIVEDSKPVVQTPQQHRHRATNSQTETPQDKREKTAFSYFTVTQRAMDINTPNSLMASLHGGRRDGRMPSQIAPYSGGSRATQVDFRQITHYSGLAEGRNARDYKDLQDVEQSETGLDRPGSGVAGGGSGSNKSSAGASGAAGSPQLAANQATNDPNGLLSQMQSSQGPIAQSTQDEENAKQATV